VWVDGQRAGREGLELKDAVHVWFCEKKNPLHYIFERSAPLPKPAANNGVRRTHY